MNNYKMFQGLPTVIFLYGSWILAHYSASHLYVYYCTPIGIYGFLWSPFSVTLPHCQALRWVIYNSGENLSGMWLLMGAWLYLQFSAFYRLTNHINDNINNNNNSYKQNSN